MQGQGLSKGAQYRGSLMSLLIRNLQGWQITASVSVAVFFKWSCHCLLASRELTTWRHQPSGGTVHQLCACCILGEWAAQRLGSNGKCSAEHTCFSGCLGRILHPHLAWEPLGTQRKPSLRIIRIHHWDSWNRDGEPSQPGYLNQMVPPPGLEREVRIVTCCSMVPLNLKTWTV